MKIEHSRKRLNVSEIEELSATNADSFRSQVEAFLADLLKNLEPADNICVDLAGVHYVDCRGVAALLALKSQAAHHLGLEFRVLNVPKSVRRVFALTGAGQMCSHSEHEVESAAGCASRAIPSVPQGTDSLQSSSLPQNLVPGLLPGLSLNDQIPGLGASGA